GRPDGRGCEARMLFATQRFLGFFVVVFAVYWLLPRHRWRMLWLLVASCAFYMSWNPLLILLVLFSASVDYIAALLLEKTESPARRKLILTLSVSTNLSLLAFFKYIHFFVSNVHSACNWLGIDFKKPVFADWLGSVLDPVYAKPGEYGSATVWLTVIAYAFQVYGDFSGYSDMAIGLAHLFGFKLKPNFNMPFLAGNISEFWNRWH